MQRQFLILAAILTSTFSFSQEGFSRRDSLKGGLSKERTDYDVLRYDLDIRIYPDRKFLSGVNHITYKLLNNANTIQIDLFENMTVDSIVQDGKILKYEREFDAVFVDLGGKETGKHQLSFYYSGNPRIAPSAPWNGGFVWDRDKNVNHWIGVAVQGTGASLWYPCKDSQSDEPDFGASVSVAVPNGLMNVSNGRFLGSEKLDADYTKWKWEVLSPINNYNITVNIADYAHIHENHGNIDLDYYVLRYNENVARRHFSEVKTMMDCFQSKFGDYPFANDGFKLVETPYLGMEHQSAVAYGNQFLKGYRGSDLSGTGIGMLFDYIIIHESGHEWFGNSVTSIDIADMWIHESFTTYSEAVYVECTQGYEKAIQYLTGIKGNVRNFSPIISTFGVNKKGSNDMYPKGALMLNTLRHIIADDQKWWSILKGFAETFRHQIIDGQTVVEYFNTSSAMNLTPVFDQYLKGTKIPELEIKLVKNGLSYRWKNTIENFEMPIDVAIGDETIRLIPTTKLQTRRLRSKLKKADIKVDIDRFYIIYK